jgi:uncharacterized protein (DUF1697 family)
MRYVALLRGINVGGNRAVPMGRLKQAFEALELSGVSTYINSGNVIFDSPERSTGRLTQRIEQALEREFGFPVGVIIRNAGEISKLVAGLPSSWVNDDKTKCDVIFLAREIDRPAIVKEFRFDPALEQVRYVPGAVIWKIDRSKQSKSKMTKIVASPAYQKMTIRNPNTVRRLHERMQARSPTEAGGRS